MLLVLVAVSLLGDPGAVEVVGSPTTVKFLPKQNGYEMARGGVTFNVTGPTAVLLEVRGKPTERGKAVQVEVLRDDEGLSRNQVSLKAKPVAAPKGYPLYGRLSWKVPDGEHKYRISAGAAAVAIALKSQPNVAGDAVAAVEQPMISDAPVAAATTTTTPSTTSSSSSGTKSFDMATSSAAANNIAADQLGGAGSATTGAPVKATRIAVYDFELAGIDPGVGAVVTDSVLAEMRKLQHVSAIGMDEIRDMLARSQQAVHGLRRERSVLGRNCRRARCR